jgi:radial spoke head protein 9
MTSELEFIGLAGKALSVPDTANIKCSLIALSQQTGKKVKLWGKVDGYNSDYYVAQAASGGNLPFDIAGRSSFYSVDGGVHWLQLLPAAKIDEEQREFCDQIRGPFMGSPSYEYKVQKMLPVEEAAPIQEADVEDAPEEELDEEDEKVEDEDGDKADEDGDKDDDEDGDDKKADAPKRPKFRILAMAESIRLAYFVSEHDHACSIVPRGAFLAGTGASTVPTRNRGFAGLDATAAVLLQNYFHVQKPADSPVVSTVVRNKEIFADTFSPSWDFLTSIVDDMPQGIWAVKYDPSLCMVTLQNLYFQGSIFYHVPNTNDFGQMYFGSGERNLDLCFVLP